MFSDEEEIDQLSGEEEDQPEISQVFDGFRLSGSLNPPRQVYFTTNELTNQIMDGTVDLNPEYQRGVVWSLSKQVALIDSIFKHYYVPPVILASIESIEGAEAMVCIDGKQRLSSIRAFIDGNIYYHDIDTKKKLYYTDNGTGPKKKKLLPEKYKKIFASRQIQCIVYSGLVDYQIRDMFQRVQQGMTLNTAERMQAIAGPKSDLIKGFEREFFNSPGAHLGEKLGLNERRHTTFHNLAQFMWIFDRYPNRTNAPTRKELQDWLASSDEPSENLENKTRSALKYFAKLSKDERYIERFRRSEIFAPVEFIFSSLLIMLHKGSLTKEDISRGIALMRKEVRLMFPGQIRTNKACCSLMWDFVTDLTVSKMDEKEVQLTTLQKFKSDEGKRQWEATQNGALGDEEMDLDVDSTPKPSSKKRKRAQESPVKAGGKWRQEDD